jgi:hypothetical protein
MSSYKGKLPFFLYLIIIIIMLMFMTILLFFWFFPGDFEFHEDNWSLTKRTRLVQKGGLVLDFFLGFF